MAEARGSSAAAYLASHDVEGVIARCVARVVNERPADPVLAIADMLAASSQAQFNLPSIVDAHHHFLSTDEPFHAFLAGLSIPSYTAASYATACSGLPVRATVHVEAMPDDPLAEVRFVEALATAGECKVGAIVAACNLADADAAAQLDALCAASPRVKGIRYILDYDGPFNGGENATHVACSRHGLDYLRDPVASKAFERGFALLAKRGLSFDLQCAPVQLPAAAALCARHPHVNVVIDHCGKPLPLEADGGAEDEAKIAEWRRGLKLMAAQPQIYVKLSMLGYAVPGWCSAPRKEALLRSLVRETIDLFGCSRCMFASNWHVNPSVSDSCGKEPGLEMPALYARFESWVSDLAPDQKRLLFEGTAAAFYHLTPA